jgi:hypothetical protein
LETLLFDFLFQVFTLNLFSCVDRRPCNS